MIRHFIAALALLLAVGAHAADTRVCLVVGVSDGDTLKVRCGEPGNHEQVTVRFNGIDAPEKAQPFGQRAKQALSELTFEKWVRLECSKLDRYGRSVCKVLVASTSAPGDPQTVDAGLAMVTQGLAWWYRAYAREQSAQDRAAYEAAETSAKSLNMGLWQDEAPVPPWDWRSERRASAAARRGGDNF